MHIQYHPAFEFPARHKGKKYSMVSFVHVIKQGPLTERRAVNALFNQPPLRTNKPNAKR